MSLRVLTWNLFHGRALPPRDEDLLDAFAERLSAWSWDVALLQEVPPWWPPALARACDAQERHALTSRNALLPLRRVVARRHPELLKANGGGCNAILVRGLGGIRVHARRRLCVWPERRVVHAVRVGDGAWFANVHASTHPPHARCDVALAHATALRWAGAARRDVAAMPSASDPPLEAQRDTRTASDQPLEAQRDTRLANDQPLVLGGDFNVVRVALPGLAHAGSSHVDHVLARGFAPAAQAESPERGDLSDHAPLLVTLQRLSRA